jgi:flagellar hook-associated protein 3 FlgL
MGVRITHAMLIRTALGDVSAQRARLARTQEQAASGLRLNRPSDDPVGTSAALLLRAGIDATAQLARTAAVARARVGASETALANAGDLLLRARELAVAGANGTQDATTRQLIAKELEGLHAALLSEANARHAGGYLFAGFASDAAPFSASGPFVGAPPSAPTVAFGGDGNEAEIALDDVSTVRVGFDGRRIFLGDADGDSAVDAGREDLFALVSDLWSALVANDPAAVAATLPRFDAGLDQLGVERTAIGSSEARLHDAGARLESRLVDLETRLSGVQDADVARVFSDLVHQETVLQAGLQATARLIQPTLLDFLA